MTPRPCVLLLGGSFDPVHTGHVALADYFIKLLGPDVLRIVPAGNPWQKAPLQASAAHRIAMLKLAFERISVPLLIDEQEILRQQGSYTIDTLRALRDELGPDVSLVWALGADQLRNFDTWHDWRGLFELAHFCVASRPGFSLADADLPASVATEFKRRLGTPAQIRDCPSGLTYLATNLSIDVSSTELRARLASGEDAGPTLPIRVLDYAKQHHLYQS